MAELHYDDDDTGYASYHDDIRGSNDHRRSFSFDVSDGNRGGTRCEGQGGFEGSPVPGRKRDTSSSHSYYDDDHYRTAKKQSQLDDGEGDSRSGSRNHNDHRGQFDRSGVDEQMSSCVTQVESPVATKAGSDTLNTQARGQQQNSSFKWGEDMDCQDGELPINRPQEDMGNHDESDSEDENDQNETPWEMFCHENANGNDASLANLEAYANAKQIRLERRVDFEQGFDDCMTRLKTLTGEMLTEGLAIFVKQTSHFEAMEDSISNLVQSNHTRRKHSLDLMKIADASWKKQYSTLNAVILAENLVQCDDDNLVMDRQQTSTADAHLNDGIDEIQEELEPEPTPGAPSHHFTSPTNELAEPDWDELWDYEPSRNAIRAFLDARESRRGDTQGVEDFFDEIHAVFEKDVLDAILQIALHLHQEHETLCLDLENDIEQYVMQNHKRREGLRKKLIESQEQAQGLFAKLQARLGHYHLGVVGEQN